MALDFLKDNFFREIPNVISGLYSGAAGVAIAVAAGLRCGFINEDNFFRGIIRNCLEMQMNELNIANGISGQGISLMYCKSYLNDSFVKESLRKISLILIGQQKKDGSWLFTDSAGRRLKNTGFSYGVSGILFFMLEYYSLSGDADVLFSIKRGLRWLAARLIYSGKSAYCYTNNRDKLVDAGLSEGFSGVALCFIKGFEVLDVSYYRDVAEALLRSHPAHLVTGNLGQAAGLAGIGEVYIEAFRVFKNWEWYHRAHWIGHVLMHSSFQVREKTYWIVNDNEAPTAGFMKGSCGVIHFFMRLESSKTNCLPFYTSIN